MAGISDWIMSLRKWQTLIVSRILSTRPLVWDEGSVLAVPVMVGSAEKFQAVCCQQ